MSDHAFLHFCSLVASSNAQDRGQVELTLILFPEWVNAYLVAKHIYHILSLATQRETVELLLHYGANPLLRTYGEPYRGNFTHGKMRMKKKSMLKSSVPLLRFFLVHHPLLSRVLWNQGGHLTILTAAEVQDLDFDTSCLFAPYYPQLAHEAHNPMVRYHLTYRGEYQLQIGEMRFTLPNLMTVRGALIRVLLRHLYGGEFLPYLALSFDGVFIEQWILLSLLGFYYEDEVDHRLILERDVIPSSSQPYKSHSISLATFDMLLQYDDINVLRGYCLVVKHECETIAKG